MDKTTLTLGHSPDPDDAFMFYALAKDLIPTHGFHFTHILQDIQTLNERATRGELDISAVSIHAYAYVSDKYALLPSGASMGDGYGPMLVAKQQYSREEMAKKKIAVPGTMTSAFLALQLWLGKSANLQAPSSRETSSSKHQATRRDPVLDLGAWCFSGAWMLVLGASFLFLLQRNDNRADHRGGQHQADDFERQNKFRHQRVTDVFDGRQGRGR